MEDVLEVVKGLYRMVLALVQAVKVLRDEDFELTDLIALVEAGLGPYLAIGNMLSLLWQAFVGL